MNITPTNSKPDRHMAFWRAYLEVLSERVTLVDQWRDGTSTWHPRVVQKLLWYSEIPNTAGNRRQAYDWLMENATQPVDPPDDDLKRHQPNNASQ